jgi:phenylpropionate dioxygenase-like ring-hydroxylating dioxygenase large terminal subunit
MESSEHIGKIVLDGRRWTVPIPRIDPSHYWSRERAALEWRHVWMRTWHMGPREQELPHPGDAFVHAFGAESLLFVRQEDGSVRGLYNTCRHRGSRLLLGADGPVSVGALRCPFHGWCYDMGGRLCEMPYRERFDAADLADPDRTNLRSFRVETFAGWLWFTLDRAAPDLAAYLGPLKDKLAAYRMELATIVDYKTFEFGCNWKTTLDAFNESYHFQTLHAAVLAWGNEDAPITQLGIHSMMVNRYGAPSPLYPRKLPRFVDR